MGNLWIAAFVALFVWWFATGAILWAVKRADRLGPGAHVTGVILGLPLLLGGAAALGWSLDRTGPFAAYAGFLSALAIWGWIELAFLSGVVTGPNRLACPARLPLWDRFLRAWGTVAYHEILLALALSGILWASAGASNPVALWTFAVLFAARVSAKLNLFLGVPRVHTEFLPRPLKHLPSHFRIARQTWAFPVSILGLSLAAYWWTERAMATGEVQYALLAALTALALLEHWLMVLPLPDDKLWRWMLPAPETDKTKSARMQDGL
ncbi:putative photosynthetic complex assembly protein 2 [Tranquillimonas rosea]|uniref:Putative photosynthetic complex assembly protein 2 n=1 Tax=Tranquillimonas rosea TaxID=641238 RepID=A0A1H9SLB2_9RHOB|nr:putative photosynthetic complex assembly protein PuhE [Tranquillimonas rosea]SER85731.1 putative photosynthetic complex assembly protein 2 [Tranquillimonas rosea]